MTRLVLEMLTHLKIKFDRMRIKLKEKGDFLTPASQRWKIPTFFFNPSLSRVQFANILGAILFVQAGQGCYSYARIEDIRIIGLIAHIGMFIVDGIDRNYYSCNSFQILVPDNRLTPE